ncbi:MAG: PilN domain-containing protein [Proteobacteria bacterium]|nr:PilN domain-containing protein [Pseudomonadota bacterium]
MRLTAGQVLQKDLALPVAVTENLRQVLEFEMERHTPFAAAQVYYGGIVLGPASDAGKVQVRLAAVPRETVDHAIDVAQNVGLSPALIGIGDPLLGLDRRINLLPGAAAAAGFPRRDRALLGLAVALAVVALVLPGIRQAVSLAIVESRIAGLEPAAKQAIGLRAQINAALAGTGTVARAKHAAPSAVGLLEELSVRLPDDTWLAQMNMVGGELEIEGTSTSAAALVSILEASPLIASVGFRTPVTRNNLTDREHFNLSLGAAAR